MLPKAYFQKYEIIYNTVFLKDKILVYVVPLYPQIFEEIKNYIMDKDSQLPTLIQHPRYVRSCFNFISIYLSILAYPDDMFVPAG